MNRQPVTPEDDDVDWQAMKADAKAKFNKDRAFFLDQARRSADDKWTRHTEHHWSRMVNGKKLDYWPSRKKWQYEGRVSRGLRSMWALITLHEKKS